jgi:hypothetical protein
MNPFNLSGPDFLVFYVFFSVVRIAILFSFLTHTNY